MVLDLCLDLELDFCSDFDFDLCLDLDLVLLFLEQDLDLDWFRRGFFEWIAQRIGFFMREDVNDLRPLFLSKGEFFNTIG